MKIFLLAITCGIFLAQMSAAWEPEDEICSKKLNIERGVLEKLIDKLIHEVDNETYNKYSECYWQEKKMLNEDGSIDWDAVKTELGPVAPSSHEFFKICDRCKEQNLVGKDVGQTIVKNQNCLMKGVFGDSKN
ncbi:hypothetical protein FQR65_LT00529 [Abscondita terminalis]|nr:hypothetical protein FQR65_LT00529 [Abscondita terminalis]